MKVKIFSLLFAMFVITHVQAQSQPNVFINVDYSKNEECRYHPLGSLSSETVGEWVKLNLMKAGLGIAATKAEATNGLEVKIKILWCGVKIDNVEFQSANLLIVALSHGTSAVAPKLKDVPFSYFSDLLVASGAPSDAHENKLRSALRESIEITLEGIFSSPQ